MSYKQISKYKKKMKVIDLLRYKIRIMRIRQSVKRLGGAISRNVKLSIGGEFRFGKGLILNGVGIDLHQWSHISVKNGALLEIGDYSGLSSFSIDCREHIRIGKYVNIGAGTLIMDSNFHNVDSKIRRDRGLDKRTAKTAPIIIEDDVFIGARSIICKGVSIGARSVIAAGSVVVKDIPADCIAGGNPCKVIRYLNNV